MSDADRDFARPGHVSVHLAAAVIESTTAPTFAARSYFALQGAAGAMWWIAVFASDDVRRWTLGSWEPLLLVGPDVFFFVLTSAWVAARLDRRVAIVCAVWTTGVTVALVSDALARRHAGWGALSMTTATVGTIAATVTIWFGGLPRRWFFMGPFAFRTANAQRRSTHVRNGLTQLVVFWTAFLLVLPLVLAWAESRIRIEWPGMRAADLDAVGLAVFTAGSVLGLSSCFAMTLFGDGTPLPAKTARKLVILGPYRFVRNPMAVAGATQTVGVGLILGAWTVVASAVVGSLVWNYFIRPDEEADLLARFGEPYHRYTTRVRCWIPTVRSPANARS